MNPYNGYEFLSFLLPGAVVLLASFFGYHGWPFEEPGATGLAGIAAASFLVGHLVAGVANLLEPVLWGDRPGRHIDSTRGLIGNGSSYIMREQERILNELRGAFGSDYSTQTLFNLAYTWLHQQDRTKMVDLMNGQIGFYRNMSVACGVAALITFGLHLTHGSHLHPALWIPLFLVTGVFSAARYRRFWRRFGDHVLRGFLAARSPAS